MGGGNCRQRDAGGPDASASSAIGARGVPRSARMYGNADIDYATRAALEERGQGGALDQAERACGNPARVGPGLTESGLARAAAPRTAATALYSRGLAAADAPTRGVGKARHGEADAGRDRREPRLLPGSPV